MIASQDEKDYKDDENHDRASSARMKKPALFITKYTTRGKKKNPEETFTTSCYKKSLTLLK